MAKDCTLDSQVDKPAEQLSALRRAASAMATIVPQVAAGFLAVFSLLNLLIDALLGGDSNIWWIDFGTAPLWLQRVLLTLAVALLLAFAIRPSASRVRQVATELVSAILLGFVLFNAVQFYLLLAKGTIRSGVPLPFSAFIAAALVVILLALRKPSLPRGRRSLCGRVAAASLVAAGVVVTGVVFAFLQMVCFGHTDYRRGASAIVVFGARAYADGTCSQALADRVRTGCELYKQGYATKLIFSGGPGDGASHETQAMRAMAMQLGVPPEAILLDEKGLNTEATAVNVAQLCRQQGFTDVLAVSHSYHLPRVKLAFQHQGVMAYTVPAHETMPLTSGPYFMAREVAAFWAYYLKPLAGGIAP